MFEMATAWLGLSVTMSALAWMAGRKLAAILLPLCVIVAAFCVFLPLGKPIPFAPAQGRYTVVGAKIVPNVAIWALLDDGKSEPRYYRLKYTNEAANQLQQALDGQAGGGPGVKVKIGEDGGQSYDGEPPVTGEQPKTPETPAISIP
jgi:hypothetical protein